MARRYEVGELFGVEVKRILAELQTTNSQVAQTELTEGAPGLKTSKRQESEPQSSTVDVDLINDLLDSIQGLE